jgi:hypothetical protein
MFSIVGTHNSGRNPHENWRPQLITYITPYSAPPHTGTPQAGAYPYR